MKLTTKKTEEFTKETMTGLLQDGAILDFTMKNGKSAQLMNVRTDGNKALLIHVDCLDVEYPMNERNSNKGGYEESDLRKTLNSEILELYPDKLRGIMVPFENGDALRIPTEKEIFGRNEYGENEGKKTQRFACMETRRNRIACQGSKTGMLEWYWLQNAAVASPTAFARCYGNGLALCCGASLSDGVRPLLQIIINQ